MRYFWHKKFKQALMPKVPKKVKILKNNTARPPWVDKKISYYTIGNEKCRQYQPLHFLR